VPLGVELEPPTVRRCANRCEFCFIEGLPEGLRKNLYIRDDDYRLSFAYGNFATLSNLKEKVEYVEGIGTTYGAKLNQAGIVTVMDLLQRGATRKGRVKLVETTGIPAALVLTWINHCDLFRIKGVGKQFAELLEAAGVDTVVELAQRNPVNLYTRMVQVNMEKKLAGRSPRQDEVNGWVEQAKGLPRVVEY